MTANMNKNWCYKVKKIYAFIVSFIALSCHKSICCLASSFLNITNQILKYSEVRDHKVCDQQKVNFKMVKHIVYTADFILQFWKFPSPLFPPVIFWR